MKVYIEDAIIVEIKEEDPVFPIETVRPELITEKKKKEKGFLDSLLSSFIDPFDSLLGFEQELFQSFNDLSFNNLINIFTRNTNEKKSEDFQDNFKKTELAEITETQERTVKEFNYFYYEVIS